jgi:hypothetical protein
MFQSSSAVGVFTHWITVYWQKGITSSTSQTQDAAGCVVQVVQRLPGDCEVLRSNPSAAEENRDEPGEPSLGKISLR